MGRAAFAAITPYTPVEEPIRVFNHRVDAIIGKGNKQRVLFFSPRALNWVKEYMAKHKDQGEALFVVGRRGRPMRLNAALVRFRRFREMIGFPKPVTAHMLRHTVATTLLFNGCPIGHIKEILGHDRLITTCNFYLGTDKRAAKKAHGRYLNYEGEQLESDDGTLERH